MSVCLNILNFCRFRVTRLDVDGSVAAGPDNFYVTDAGVSLAFNPDVEIGVEENVLNGCGCITATRKEPNLLKRYDLNLVSSSIEPELLVMLLDADAIEDTGEVVGYSIPAQVGCDRANPAPVAIEGWAKGWAGDHVDVTWPWFHIIFPYSTWQQAEQTLQSQFLQPGYTAFTAVNPLFGTGPYGDLPAAVPTDSLFYGVFTDEEPPAAVCGAQTVST